jgi:hypothetical protein
VRLWDQMLPRIFWISNKNSRCTASWKRCF